MCMYTSQSTLVPTTVEKLTNANRYCQKIMGVKNGKKEFCQYKAKYRISEDNNEFVIHLCGIHTKSEWKDMVQDND